MRAHAKHLGLSPQELSEILRGKRHLPVKKAEVVTKKLNLSAEQTRKFNESLRAVKTRLKDIAKLGISSEFELTEERHFRIISEWEYYAVITLLETNIKYQSYADISERLGLKSDRTKFVIECLIEEKMIHIDDQGFLQKSTERLSTTKDIPSKALKRGHQDILDLAIQKIDTVPVEDRFYSASTIAIKKENLNEAKNIIREFRAKLSTMISSGDPDEVYQMNIQLFPLTE